MATTAYCVKCREKDRAMVDEEKVEMNMKGGKTRPAVKGKCETCGTMMFRIVKKEE